MNIKKLNPYKELFLTALDGLPIEAMEEDIKGSGDPLITQLYTDLLKAVDLVKWPKYKKVYRQLGICSIYALVDPCYGDPLRWMLHNIQRSPKLDIKAKAPRNWRVNTQLPDKFKPKEEKNNVGSL